eukprot:TRINITY_DN109_c0_g1_i6.p2 TRINITY_DN109_c0_g1~~TRINITY_DN109_c0_g1_i6.p2  ORF type:complete len:120 (+),score=10.80 TRINITY_DN109_c0_g1_i6:1255-1614(+)
MSALEQPRVSGLATEWKHFGRVRFGSTGRIAIGDSQRLEANTTPPELGVAVERMVEAHEVLWLLPPACVSVRSERAQRYSVCCAKAVEQGDGEHDTHYGSCTQLAVLHTVARSAPDSIW